MRLNPGIHESSAGFQGHWSRVGISNKNLLQHFNGYPLLPFNWFRSAAEHHRFSICSFLATSTRPVPNANLRFRWAPPTTTAQFSDAYQCDDVDFWLFGSEHFLDLPTGDGRYLDLSLGFVA